MRGAIAGAGFEPATFGGDHLLNLGSGGRIATRAAARPVPLATLARPTSVIAGGVEGSDFASRATECGGHWLPGQAWLP